MSTSGKHTHSLDLGDRGTLCDHVQSLRIQLEEMHTDYNKFHTEIAAKLDSIENALSDERPRKRSKRQSFQETDGEQAQPPSLVAITQNVASHIFQAVLSEVAATAKPGQSLRETLVNLNLERIFCRTTTANDAA